MDKNKKFVIVDIDGTVANLDHRIKYVNVKMYESFYELAKFDEPIKPVVDLVNLLQYNYNILFLTNRPESIRVDTIIWLEKNGLFVNRHNLLMRSTRDYRPDTIVKFEKLNKFFEQHSLDYDSISFVLEDRDTMVKAWRDLDIQCLQVNYGDH